MLGEKGFVFIQTLSFFRVGSWREHISLQMLVAPFRECDCRTSTVRLAVPSPKRWLVHSVFKGEPHAVSRAKSTIIEDCPVQWSYLAIVFLRTERIFLFAMSLSSGSFKIPHLGCFLDDNAGFQDAYPLVIKYTNGKWHIYRWFPIEISIFKGFMTPEATPGGPPTESWVVRSGHVHSALGEEIPCPSWSAEPAVAATAEGRLGDFGWSSWTVSPNGGCVVFLGYWLWEDISPASNQMCQMALEKSPRKVGHVSEDLEVYVPKGSAHGETILFRGKVSDCRTSWLRNWRCFFGNPCGWMVNRAFPKP